jgi:glyoxylase-like metal-dependent hydrolase (beta-lactamase superfamily II)
MESVHRVISASAWLLLGILTALPAFAQMDFSGEWAPVQDEDNTGNPYLGEFVGIPMSDAGRTRAEIWDASIQTLPEWQCRPHGFAYISRGPSQLRIWKEVDPVSRQTTAFHAEWLRSIDNPIYLDGRPHPPEYAPHTWGGFSTAVWEGDVLKITTTHLKEEYLRRNGVAVSDAATITTYWIRRGDILTWVNIVYDPIYLSEPMIRSSEYRLTLAQQIPPYPCTVVEEVDRPEGAVPHHLPGANPFLTEFSEKYKVPQSAARGGAESMYPAGHKIDARVQQAARNRYFDRFEDGDVRVLPVRKNVYMLLGAGGNITVSAGPDGVLLVDSGRGDLSAKVIAAINKLQREVNGGVAPTKPIRYIINTSVLPEHTGGNEKLGAAGATFTGGNVSGDLAGANQGAAVMAHEEVLNRMSAPSGSVPAAPSGALPTETYYSKKGIKLSHFMNGEGVQILHPPAASTDGDSMVYFRGADVISTGDIFNADRFPVIDLSKGGSVQGVIDALNQILDLAIAEFRTEGGTMIVPGHGRLCDSGDVAYYRDMVTIIRDRVRDMIGKNMTLAQVKAARPGAGYDTRFGSDTGEWTTDRFVEAVYRSLGGKN